MTWRQLLKELQQELDTNDCWDEDARLQVVRSDGYYHPTGVGGILFDDHERPVIVEDYHRQLPD